MCVGGGGRGVRGKRLEYVKFPCLKRHLGGESIAISLISSVKSVNVDALFGNKIFA